MLAIFRINTSMAHCILSNMYCILCAIFIGVERFRWCIKMWRVTLMRICIGYALDILHAMSMLFQTTSHPFYVPSLYPWPDTKCKYPGLLFLADHDMGWKIVYIFAQTRLGTDSHMLWLYFKNTVIVAYLKCLFTLLPSCLLFYCFCLWWSSACLECCP